jgi:hypothetical protein
MSRLTVRTSEYARGNGRTVCHRGILASQFSGWPRGVGLVLFPTIGHPVFRSLHPIFDWTAWPLLLSFHMSVLSKAIVSHVDILSRGG